MEKETVKKLLSKFYIEYHNSNYKEAVLLLNGILLKEEEEDFWIYSRLSSCHYELKDYEMALFYAKKAYKLNPDSPLVLWDYAGVLIMLKKERNAIELLKRIQNMSNDLTEHGFMDPDVKWMKSLKNDANFLIGKAYYLICEDALSKIFLSNYLSNRESALKSIYTREDALLYLEKVGI
ncbi:tetratricopeptide repeat protein [Pedobacter caeni]|uniref:Tetratricopeptide repeat-containing protein n=1 Tax=Pedobacter caeni TaxID=288992 RepID=A0A1M4WWK9_9SPHI|nr:tetratricopeptide repeat protein [Pedobacter caeni]SHE85585.1 Tetratricopeptide repeat-containing protein [Pedobacter caeni]